MEPGLSDLQAGVVNAFLDQFEADPDWSTGFVYADYANARDGAGPLCKAFLVRRPPDPERPDYVALEWATIAALIALQKGYTRAGQAFEHLDLEIEAADGRYRFHFGRDGALPGAEQDGALKSGQLLQRYQEMIARS